MHPADDGFMSHVKDFYKTTCHVISIILEQNIANTYFTGTRGGAVGRYTAPQAGRSRVRFPMVSLKFHWHNPPGHTMALGSNQSLTEMSTRNISWGDKGGQYVGLTNLPPSPADCLWRLRTWTSWNTHSLSRSVMGLLYPYLSKAWNYGLWTGFKLGELRESVANHFCVFRSLW